MDRTRTCGVRNAGSIPAEGAMEIFEKIQKENEEIAALRNELKSLRAQKELHEDSMKKESINLIENENSMSEEEKESLKESISKSDRTVRELNPEIEAKEEELKKLEEQYETKE